MGIIRIILVAGLIWLIFSFYRYLRMKFNSAREIQKTGSIGKMVKCESCGIHILVDEAVISNGLYYCCNQHQAKINQERQE
jgi:uncharacterized protein